MSGFYPLKPIEFELTQKCFKLIQIAISQKTSLRSNQIESKDMY